MTDYSNWQLEQYVLNELTPDQMDAISRQAEEDPDLASRLKAIETSNLALHTRLPVSVFADRLTQQPSASEYIYGLLQKIRENFFSPQGFGVATAAVFAVFMAVQFIPVHQQTAQQPILEDQVRLKGMLPYFKVFKLINQQAEELEAQQPLAENDVLQVSYVAAGHDYGYLLSVDGNGVLTVHLDDQGKPAQLNKDGETQLASAYMLDNAPIFERFVFVSSPLPFEVSLVNDALNQLIEQGNAQYGELEFPEPIYQNLSVSSITFLKESKE